MSTFQSLRNVNYRLYATGGAVSNIGTWVQRIAQDWLVLQLTDNSGSAIGITTGLQFLPFLILGPLGGMLADRFSKRKILLYAQIGASATAASLALLDVAGIVQVWHVFVLAFLLGSFDALANPARQSFVVEMVGKRDLANAVALNAASFNAARIVGPAIAGFLIMLVGTGWVIGLNAITYAATIYALLRMDTSKLDTPTPVPRGRGMTRDGLRYLKGRPDLLLVLCVVLFVGCFGLNFQLTSALMATTVFGKGSGEFGILASFMAIGSLAGALRAARRGNPRLRTVAIGAVLFGVVEIVTGVMPTYVSYAIVLPLLGFTSMTMITSANSLMQMSVAPEMRGRTMAVYSMVFIGSTPIGSPLIGWIGDALGARWTLIIGGVASLGGALLAVALLGRQVLAGRSVVPVDSGSGSDSDSGSDSNSGSGPGAGSGSGSGGEAPDAPVATPVLGPMAAGRAMIGEQVAAGRALIGELRTAKRRASGVAGEERAVRGAREKPEPDSQGLSVAADRMPSWKLPGISRRSNRITHASPRLPRQGLTRPSRRARAGRSGTS